MKGGGEKRGGKKEKGKGKKRSYMGKKWEVKISVDDVMNCPFFKFINMSLNWEMKIVFCISSNGIK